MNWQPAILALLLRALSCRIWLGGSPSARMRIGRPSRCCRPGRLRTTVKRFHGEGAHTAISDGWSPFRLEQPRYGLVRTLSENAHLWGILLKWRSQAGLSKRSDSRA